MTDIRNGVYAGQTVTVHDTEINFNGWRGTGYLILDPESGAGAYMIGGGLDGGFLLGVGVGGLTASGLLFAAIPASAVVLAIVVLVLALVFTMILLLGLIDAAVHGISTRCFIEGLANGLSFTAIGAIAGLNRPDYIGG